MRTLKDIILEKLKVDDINFDTLDEELKEKYNLVYNQRTGFYDCNEDINVDNDLITDGHFICDFGVVKGRFNCSWHNNLKSLEGAPRKVGRDFWCNSCKNLKSLEGAPKEVGGDFICTDCKKVESLKGAPEKVNKGFYCNNCTNLKSLEGAPKEVGGDFCSYNCKNLKNYYDINSNTKISGKIYR